MVDLLNDPYGVKARDLTDVTSAKGMTTGDEIDLTEEVPPVYPCFTLTENIKVTGNLGRVLSKIVMDKPTEGSVGLYAEKDSETFLLGHLPLKAISTFLVLLDDSLDDILGYLEPGTPLAPELYLALS